MENLIQYMAETERLCHVLRELVRSDPEWAGRVRAALREYRSGDYPQFFDEETGVYVPLLQIVREKIADLQEAVRAAGLLQGKFIPELE